MNVPSNYFNTILPKHCQGRLKVIDLIKVSGALDLSKGCQTG